MGKPHKHAELIKAWAEGAEIEQRYFEEHYSEHWQSFEGDWDDGCLDFRIKPQKQVKRWLYAYIEDGVWVQGQAFFSDEEIKTVSNKSMVKLLWTETEFDE